jgi:uncharacterized membrane protein YagU involved in acid resistance
LGIERVTQGDEHGSEATLLAPASVAIVDCLGGAVALGNITALGTGVQLPKQAIQDAAVLRPRMTTSRAWLGQIGFKQQILLISQFVSAHQHRSFLLSDALMLQVFCHRYQIIGQKLPLLKAAESTVIGSSLWWSARMADQRHISGI